MCVPEPDDASYFRHNAREKRFPVRLEAPKGDESRYVMPIWAFKCPNGEKQGPDP
jgi:hypothetical protein